MRLTGSHRGGAGKRKAPPAPRPKRRRKTKAAPVEPVLSEYELGRRAKIKRNNKFLVSARTQRLHSIASRRPTHWSIILGGAAVPAEGADAASPFHRIATITGRLLGRAR